MLEEMPAGLLLAWQEFYRQRPPIETVVNWTAAQQAALTANSHRDPKKRSRPFGLREFVMDFDPQPIADALTLQERLTLFCEATQAVYGDSNHG